MLRPYVYNTCTARGTDIAASRGRPIPAGPQAPATRTLGARRSLLPHPPASCSRFRPQPRTFYSPYALAGAMPVHPPAAAACPRPPCRFRPQPRTFYNSHALAGAMPVHPPAACRLFYTASDGSQRCSGSGALAMPRGVDLTDIGDAHRRCPPSLPIIFMHSPFPPPILYYYIQARASQLTTYHVPHLLLVRAKANTSFVFNGLWHRAHMPLALFGLGIEAGHAHTTAGGAGARYRSFASPAGHVAGPEIQRISQTYAKM
jgi:hypothetical protein